MKFLFALILAAVFTFQSFAVVEEPIEKTVKINLLHDVVIPAGAKSVKISNLCQVNVKEVQIANVRIKAISDSGKRNFIPDSVVIGNYTNQADLDLEESRLDLSRYNEARPFFDWLSGCNDLTDEDLDKIKSMATTVGTHFFNLHTKSCGVYSIDEMVVRLENLIKKHEHLLQKFVDKKADLPVTELKIKISGDKTVESLSCARNSGFFSNAFTFGNANQYSMLLQTLKNELEAGEVVKIILSVPEIDG